jgi:SET domain-containing protein
LALLEKHLEVRKSRIPGAGLGLFTKVFIPKGTRIVEYKGRVSSWKEADHKDGRNGYIYYLKRDHVIDASNHVKSLARYANDAKGIQKVSGLRNNSDYVSEGVRVFIESTRDIPANSEILVDYGKEYWDVIRFNRRLWAKEEKEKQKLNGKVHSKKSSRR